MTCIVAATDGASVVMGGDSAGVNESLGLWVRADQKVFRAGSYLLGFTSSFRMGQVLRYGVALPEPPDATDLHGFMCTTLVDACRSAFKAAGWAKKENEVESGGTFLVAVRGQIFEVCDNYQVAQYPFPYAAVGCGQGLALGALHALHDLPPDLRPSARAMVGKAFSATHAFSAGVRPPFHVVALEAAE